MNRTRQQMQTWQLQEKEIINLIIILLKHFRVIRKHAHARKQATNACVILCPCSLTHHSPDDRENKSHVKLGVVIFFSFFRVLFICKTMLTWLTSRFTTIWHGMHSVAMSLYTLHCTQAITENNKSIANMFFKCCSQSPWAVRINEICAVMLLFGILGDIRSYSHVYFLSKNITCFIITFGFRLCFI